MIIDVWNGCYPSNWNGTITPGAMAHPAKYSSKLIRKIYEHMRNEGWIKHGDVVIDPFGGVALGALDAMRLGLTWRGVELEPRFVNLGNENIALWNKRFASMMPHWGLAELLQGDSRELCKIIAPENDAIISSPPYAETRNAPGGNNMDDMRRNYHGDGGYSRVAGAISSPPYADSINSETHGIDFKKSEKDYPGRVMSDIRVKSHDDYHQMRKYGKTPGQLGAMKSKGFDAAISSPPYAKAATGGALDSEKYPTLRGVLKDNAANLNKISETEGQLSNMKNKGYDAAITSPPYGKDALGHAGGEGPQSTSKNRDDYETANKRLDAKSFYGDASKGNLGNSDDFWLAARAIVEQVFLALAPGGHAVWVVKDFVKNKQRVPFCDQWRELCEAVGFVTVHEHHASLVRHKGTSFTLDGDLIEHTVSSKSFFRRLAEKKGGPPIDYEVVFCMEKK